MAKITEIIALPNFLKTLGAKKTYQRKRQVEIISDNILTINFKKETIKFKKAEIYRIKKRALNETSRTKCLRILNELKYIDYNFKRK